MPQIDNVRGKCEHVFVPSGRRKYDWDAIRRFYEEGWSPSDCKRRFGFSNGAWDYAIKCGRIVLRETRNKPRNQTREAVERLISEGLSQAEVARRLGIAKPTVCFHLRKLGVPARAEFARRFDWEPIREYYTAGHSVLECWRRFDLTRSAWAAAVARGVIEPRPRLEPIESVLAPDRPRSRTHVKARLLLAGLKPQHCEVCGLAEWRGRKLPLELHHINGNGRDNRLENLLVLCPKLPQPDRYLGRSQQDAHSGVGTTRGPRPQSPGPHVSRG